MQTLTRPIFVLHPEPRVLELLGGIPGHPYRVEAVADWDRMIAQVRRASPTAVAVVSPFGVGTEADGVSERIRDLLREFPSLTVVAAFEVRPSNGSVLKTLVDWGIADWLDLSREETPAAVVRRLHAVRSRPVLRLLRRALPRGVPSRSRHLLRVAADVVADGGQVPEFAAALKVAERTVPRWCGRADLPAPRRLLAWLRLLMAADLLDDTSRSIESVSRACGFAGAPSLKTSLRNLLNTSVVELRARGAFDTAGAAFARELFDLRETGRDRPGRAQESLH